MAGETDSYGAGWGDMYLIKVNERGETVWQHTYGGRVVDLANAVAITRDGGYIMAGFTGFTDPVDDTLDGYIVKVDGAGNLIWEKVIGTKDADMMYGVTAVPAGGYIVAGFSERQDGSIWLVRLDEEGSIIWQNVYGQYIDEIVYCVVPTSDGGFVAAGSSYVPGVAFRAYMIKVDGSGKLNWERPVCSEVGAMSARSVIVTPDDAYVVTGWSRENGTDFFVAKLDQSGSTIWATTYGGVEHDYAYSVIATPDGGFIVGGATWSYGGGNNDVCLIKIGGSGNLIWEKTYGGTSNEQAMSVAAAPDGGYVVGGMALSPVSSGEYYLLKVDANGDL